MFRLDHGVPADCISVFGECVFCLQKLHSLMAAGSLDVSVLTVWTHLLGTPVSIADKCVLQETSGCSQSDFQLQAGPISVLSGSSGPFTTNELLANSWPSQKGWQVFYPMAMYSTPTIQGEAEAWGQGMQHSNYSGWMGSCSCRLPVGAALSSHLTMQQVHSDSGGFRFRRRANLTCSVFAGVCKEWE